MPKNFLDRHTVRGIRNNNPGNLIITSSTWVGKLTDGKDAKFERFVNMRYGLRALLVNLKNQFPKGFNTVSKIITKYAPANENNTKAYIANVCQDLGVSATAVLNPTQGTILALSKAIVAIENGKDAAALLDTSDYSDAWDAIGHTSVKKAVEWLYYLPLFIPFVAYALFSNNN